ncbi:MAG: hypothetical protein EPO08_20865 [Rhodospirillaceae bacterium]|nr:MAG: hypothetical protein EPO08_20865 [Rhodospirillaceae bacterium]
MTPLIQVLLLGLPDYSFSLNTRRLRNGAVFFHIFPHRIYPSMYSPIEFIRESNRIEGIVREPSVAEIAEHIRFMALDMITIEDLQQFVSVYQPGARLRDTPGMNVRVGNHVPPKGGTDIPRKLRCILSEVSSEARIVEFHPFHIHQLYETLHPFTDGNGRSGRMLWAWQMNQWYREESLALGFLHRWYYDSLSFGRN